MKRSEIVHLALTPKQIKVMIFEKDKFMKENHESQFGVLCDVRILNKDIVIVFVDIKSHERVNETVRKVLGGKK